jgi:hypothetical protein
LSGRTTSTPTAEGYQTSQYALPLTANGRGGAVAAKSARSWFNHRAHLEGTSWLFRRADHPGGLQPAVPLMIVVTSRTRSPQATFSERRWRFARFIRRRTRHGANRCGLRATSAWRGGSDCPGPSRGEEPNCSARWNGRWVEVERMTGRWPLRADSETRADEAGGRITGARREDMNDYRTSPAGSPPVPRRNRWPAAGPCRSYLAARPGAVRSSSASRTTPASRAR